MEPQKHRSMGMLRLLRQLNKNCVNILRTILMIRNNWDTMLKYQTKYIYICLHSLVWTKFETNQAHSVCGCVQIVNTPHMFMCTIYIVCTSKGWNSWYVELFLGKIDKLRWMSKLVLQPANDGLLCKREKLLYHYKFLFLFSIYQPERDFHRHILVKNIGSKPSKKDKNTFLRKVHCSF